MPLKIKITKLTNTCTQGTNVRINYFLVTLALPRTCSEVYPKVEGFYETKPSLDDLPLTVFCSYANGAG